MSKFSNLWQKYGMLALLIVMIIFFSLAAPDKFPTEKTFFNIMKQASVVGVCACCVCMQLITGGIDLSIGARLAFSELILAKMLLNGSPIWLSCLVCILVACATGALNAILAEVLKTGIFVVSIATMYIYTGICYLMVGAATLYGFSPEFLKISGTLVFGRIPSIIFIFIACSVVAWFILAKTTFGRHMYALGGNREAARLVGINVVKTHILTHTVSNAFVGIAAIILLSRVATAGAGTSASTYAFDCICACVLGGVAIGGGFGNMPMTVMGILVLNVTFNGLTILHVSDYWQMAIKGAILLGAIGLELIRRSSNARETKKAVANTEKGAEPKPAEA